MKGKKKIFPFSPERQWKKKKPRGLDQSDELMFLGQQETKNDDGGDDSQDTKEPFETDGVATGDRYVHAEETTDEIEGDQNGGDDGDLAEDVVGVISLFDPLHRNLSQVIGMGSREHLFEMGQVGHHREHVILDVAKVESDFGSGRDRVLFVASFGEALDHVGFAAEKSHDAHHLATTEANLSQQRVGVIGSSHKHFILDHVRLTFNVVDQGTKGVDNVIAGVARR